MCSAISLGYSDLIDSFRGGNLDGVYLVVATVMSYTGIIRAVDSDSIIMDIPLKFYAGDNVMYTPVIIGRAEVLEIKEVPISGYIKIKTKNDGEFAGEIETAFSNRMVIDSNGKNIIVYYQDFVNIE